MKEFFIQLLPFFIALFGVGGFAAAYMSYRGQKPKVNAESQKINADVVVTFAEGWEKIAKDFERRLGQMEIRYEDRIKKHEADYENLQRQIDEYRDIIRKKDDRIDELEGRVNELEFELRKYQGQEVRTEEARDELHHEVDASINKIKSNKN